MYPVFREQKRKNKTGAGQVFGFSFGIRRMIGIGTIITAFFMGPPVDFFNRKAAQPMRYGKTACNLYGKVKYGAAHTPA